MIIFLQSITDPFTVQSQVEHLYHFPAFTVSTEAFSIVPSPCVVCCKPISRGGGSTQYSKGSTHLVGFLFIFLVEDIETRLNLVVDIVFEVCKGCNFIKDTPLLLVTN